MSTPLTILCISSAYKGVAMLRGLKAQGCRVLLIVPEKIKDEDWPMDAVDEKYVLPHLLDTQNIINAIAFLMRTERIARILPLDDYEVETTAVLREYFRMPGLGVTNTTFWRDKLAMRQRALEVGIPVPEFSPVFHHHDLHEWMQRVPAPWLLKPRSEAGAMGIKKCKSEAEVWAHINSMGDLHSHFLLEQFVPSDVFHVDSIVWDGQIQFNIASAYGQPPLSVSHGGGVFTTQVLDGTQSETAELFAMNRHVIDAFGLPRGVTHIEFLRSHADGKLRFLEGAARVGGANISDMIEHASGLNPWTEWARMEVAHARGEHYQLPPARSDSAGIVICLAKQEWPNLDDFDDPEVVWRLSKRYHAGVIVRSPDAGRVQALMQDYALRFQKAFVNWLPPLDTGRA